MIVDAHIHYLGDHADALTMLAVAGVKLLNVAVAHGPGDPWRDGAASYRALAAHFPGRYGWCTTFDPPDTAVWATPANGHRYADAVIAGLDRDFATGAVGCKVWKSIGMRLRKPSGEFAMIDDHVFDAIFEHLAACGRPLLMHIGEPLACWQALDENNAHTGYYRDHREWYMGDKPDYPSHRALIDARDRVVARHPALRVIGAHLASLEYDVAEIGVRLERYPNLAVDTSARLQDLVRQDRATVRDFLIRYADRILYGTDVVQSRAISALDAPDRAAHLESMARRYAVELAYYTTDAPAVLYGVETCGLALPPDVADAVLGENALRWYPGL